MTECHSTNGRSLASVSLDLDNQWAFMKTHGDANWETFPSYLDTVVPSILKNLDRAKLKITFFIVGQDAALDKNREVLQLLTESGHEVGNHSFHHDPWLHLHSKDRIEKEILDTEEQLLKVTGHKPIGFRGPGFVWSECILEALAQNSYLYDASTLPTYLGPLARAYFFWNTSFTAEEKNKRMRLFGTFGDGMRPVKPYYWQFSSGKNLLEIPVTTIPFIKTPFHFSYLLYLSRFSFTLASFYLNIAIALCRLTQTEPSFLLHPLDFIDDKKIPELAFFPGMDLSASRKIQIFEKVLRQLSKYFTLVKMSTHAESIIKRKKIATRQL